jgi:hypothetical protein
MAGAALALAEPALAEVPGGEQLFLVRRGDDAIGWHRVRLLPDGSATRVEIDIELVVRLAFIPVYRYVHANRERWDERGLLEIAARTDDNGSKLAVDGRRQGERLVIDGPSGRLELPVGTLTTTYWRRDFIYPSEWLDTQNGKLVRSTVRPAGQESLRAAGTMVSADRYRLEGDLDMDIWYRGTQWVALRFTASDGSRIAYELQPPGTTVAMLDL